MQQLSRFDAAGQLCEQAAACRELCATGRTPGGAAAVNVVADHFGYAADRSFQLGAAWAARGEAMAKNLSGDTDQEELEHYETERVPADVFLGGGYRCSNMPDALAAEKCGGKR